eukprot:8873926-Pyramimonas_sp.AAC.1
MDVLCCRMDIRANQMDIIRGPMDHFEHHHRHHLHHYVEVFGETFMIPRGSPTLFFLGVMIGKERLMRPA